MAKKWNADIMFPSDNCFENRITDIKAAPSNGGNPMITMSTELVSPTVYEIAGEEVDITGVKATAYYTYKVFDGEEVDAEKTKSAQERTEKLLVDCGIAKEDINWDNLGPVIAPLKGKVILTCMNSRIDEQRKTPTSVQLEEARKTGKRAEGDVMKHPVTGKKLIKYWPNVVEVYGLKPV